MRTHSDECGNLVRVSKQRAFPIHLALLSLVLIVILSMSAQSASTMAPAAVGDNSLWLTGSRPGSPDFSGYVEVGYSPALNPTSGGITIEGWVKRIAADRHETLVGNGWRGSYWVGFYSDGRLRFYPHGSDSLATGNGTVPAGVWTHVAVTYDGVNTSRFYINGVLDKVASVTAGPLESAPSGQALGIGFDAHDDFTPNYFGGGIDNVRIWNVVRSSAQIKDGMFQSIAMPHPGLLAEWSFDGDASDGTGNHDGSLVGYYTSSNEGAIPHDIRIPQVSGTPSLDGFCNTGSEYANATQVTVDGTGVWLMHTADDMWVCFDDLGASVETAQVYLDVDYTRQDPAQPEHLRLEVKDDDTLRAQEGTGSNTYTDTVAANGLWDGKYMVCCGDFPTYRAEFRISHDLLDGWSHVIGLALGKSTGERGGFDLWPALSASYLPSTWSSAILGGAGDPRTFAGHVVYQPRDSAADPVGIAGVTVSLIGSDPSGGEALVATDETNLDGSFSVSGDDDYTEHRLEMGAPPKGYLAKEAEVGPPGVVIDARTIDYGTAISGTYTGSVFILGDALPYVVDWASGPRFLIVAPQHIIDSGALDEFVDFKRRVGFAVEVISLETVDATFAGANRLEKIRALEQDRFETHYGLLDQYLLLIGTMHEIPFGQFAMYFAGLTGWGAPDLDACRYPAAYHVRWYPSDWVYADLASDFDSNGNGCLLDGIDLAGDAIKADGYVPDELPDFHATVAVGRIPFNTESGVRSVLTNILRFEQKTESFKNRTLLAMSHYWINGIFWYPPDSMYYSCSLKDDKPNVTGVSNSCAGGTEDAAVYGEQMKSDFLNDQGCLSTILYEAVKIPGGQSSPVVSPKPLTAQNVLDTLEETEFGMVNVGGHGTPGSVLRAHWVDINGDGWVESPTAPISGTSENEILDDTPLIRRNGMNNHLTPDNDRGAIYILAACATGDPRSNSFGANVLEQGHGVGWVGMMDGVRLAAPVDLQVTERLLKNNLRLGDAVWYALDELCAHGGGTARWLSTLYGDPTLSYWGNPGGQSLLAAWPMLRFDGRGQGYTPLAGPEVPKTMWEYSGSAPGTATLPPSPVVSNNGEVIVAHGSYVDVLREGGLYQRLNLDGAAFGTPAIAADGTIYALDVNGNLYAFKYNSYELVPVPSFSASASTQLAEASTSGGGRFRRWKLDLDTIPTTSPIVGPDGFIVVGGSSRIKIVRPDGMLFRSFGLVQGEYVGALAIGADRLIYGTTATGHITRLSFDPDGSVKTVSGPGCSTPPLLAYGYVYAGLANGQVVKLSKNTLGQMAIFQADGEVTAGPVIGPGGQVLVGTVNGTLYSLTENLSLRWQRSIGAAVSSVPAFSADALYIVGGDALRAYNPYSGEPIWTYGLGSGAGNGSVAVGYGREIYVQTGSGKVIAVGEGWTDACIALAADSVKPTPGRKAVQVRWRTSMPPLDSTSGSVLHPAAAQSTVVGILLQRSADGGDWEDVAILPPGTTVYTDTNILPNTSYAYRAQVLDSEGNDSDFTITLVNVQSLPSVPIAPTLEAVTVEAADALGVVWSSPMSDVVSGYRLERSLSTTGPFTVALQIGGGVTSTVDMGLEPATDYYYRVVAINGAGESDPSEVLSGTTRSQSLSAPEHVTATLVISNLVQISWTEGPVGATTVIEVRPGLMGGYVPLATTDATGPYNYYLGAPNVYIHRVKFVLGDAESAYVTSGVIDTREEYRVYLPLVLHGN
jgi:hypothetical protein